MSTLKITGAPHATALRGAHWAAALFVPAWRALAQLFSAAPRALSPAEEAAEVREMARRLAATDPGFAADLMAAADRHEQEAR